MSQRGGDLRRDPLFLIPALVIAVIAALAIAPGLWGAGGQLDCDLSFSLDRPSFGHPFGYDLQGCDYYTKVLYGARTSLTVGGSVTLLVALVGILAGALAGYYGGIFDAVLGRFGDMVLAIPLILVGAVILGFFEDRTMIHLIGVLSVFAWPPMARLVRGQVIQIKKTEYVEAARVMGAGDTRLLRKHILPNSLWPVLVYATSYVAIPITAEAVLTFLGVGLQLPAVSWGLQLAGVRDRLLEHPHLLIPGAFLSATVASFVFMGEALRRRRDPRGG